MGIMDTLIQELNKDKKENEEKWERLHSKKYEIVENKNQVLNNQIKVNDNTDKTEYKYIVKYEDKWEINLNCKLNFGDRFNYEYFTFDKDANRAYILVDGGLRTESGTLVKKRIKKSYFDELLSKAITHEEYMKL